MAPRGRRQARHDDSPSAASGGQALSDATARRVLQRHEGARTSRSRIPKEPLFAFPTQLVTVRVRVMSGAWRELGDVPLLLVDSAVEVMRGQKARPAIVFLSYHGEQLEVPVAETFVEGEGTLWLR